MLDIRGFKNEVTLADIADNEDKRDKKLTFAVIIDVSEPHTYEDNKNYVTKLKVIDPSFNYLTYLQNKKIKFHKYVTITIYSQFLARSPKIKNVGDILRMRRFNFVVNDKGELRAYHNNYSNWLIFQGNKGTSFKPTSFKEYEKNVDRDLTDFEKNRVEELRNWSFNFFQSYRLKFITWWTALREPADEEKAVRNEFVASEVDLILKTEKVLKEKKAVEFVDHNGKRYGLFLQVTPVLVKGDVIKLRCVNVIFLDEGRIIQLTKNSSCLIVPEYFYDAQLFNKSARVSPAPSSIRTPDRRTGRISKPGTPLSTKREANNTFPFLIDFEYDRFLVENPDLKKITERTEYTLIKKSYVHKMPTPMQDLLDILESPAAYEHHKFVVSGKIVSFSSNSVATIVKKFDEHTKKIYEYNEKVPPNAGFIRYIYHFMITMKDASLEESSKPFSAYVLTHECDQHLFDLWEHLPRADDLEAWQTLPKQNIAQFEKKMDALTKIEIPIKLVVQLLITDKGRPFYKLFDTIFLP